MTSRTRSEESCELPFSVLELADKMYCTYFSGQRAEAARMRRRLVYLIRRELERDPRNVRLWCVLGDTYTVVGRQIEYYKCALRIDLNDAEANAELASLYARSRKRLFAKHFDRALKNCRRSEVEASVISEAMDAAKAAGDEQREERARRLGARRYPNHTLFRN